VTRLSAAGALPSWFSYSRAAAYSVTSKPVRVPMRDGASLGCTVFRPAAGRRTTPTRAPAIVMNFWPYYSQTTFSYEVPEARYFASHGYAVLICAMRGTYNSEGTFPGWWTASDARDNYDLVEWAARQPWSIGRVGETGVSYAGVNTLKVAAMRPPHLVAIVPQFAFHNAYLDYFYPGGIANDASQSPAPGVTAYRGVTPAQQNAVWSAHPLDDAYWQEASVRTDKIRVPTLFIGGWQDYMLTGDIANYHALERSNAWLVMGPWEHGITPPSLTSSIELAWFDHWLRRLPLAPLPSARVTSFEMPDVAGSRWTEMSSYPPRTAVHRRFDLTGGQTLDPNPGPSATASYVVDPHDGPPAVCFPPGQPPCDPSTDVANADARRLTFTSAPLQKPLVVVGSMQVHLRASLSSTDGNLVVKVMDVGPDGSVHQASVGYLKASHRLSQSHPTAIVPDTPTDFVISLWPMDWRFAPGHRLRLSFTSGDYPKIAPDAPSGSVTIATGKGGSYVALRAR
jgi:predicted acyl esterase